MMKSLKLGTLLNISFALVLFVPMLTATVFSIGYYSREIRRQAEEYIASAARTAEIVYNGQVSDMAAIAGGLAGQKGLSLMLEYRLGAKIGGEWAKRAEKEGLDMITVVNPQFEVQARSHAPGLIGDTIPSDRLLENALAGTPSFGTELLDADFLRREGLEMNLRLMGSSARILATVGVAPVTHAQSGEIIAAVVVHRFLNRDPDRVLLPIARDLKVNAALFAGETQVGIKESPESAGEFIAPPVAVLRDVLETGTSVTSAEIREGGSISTCFPVRDAAGRSLGALAVQTGVSAYLHTRYIAVISLSGVCVVGLILALILKTIITRRIVTPLSHLKTEAKRIGGGDYSHQLDVVSDDEIGELTGAFNEMVTDLAEYDHQIKEYNQQLEARVEARTRELQEANLQLTEANTVLEDTLETLNPGVSRLIKRNKQQLGLIFGTELVADVCNYTKLNMILGETMMGEFMKKFFREGHKLLAMYRGMFDKTVGDQIVAIFGTPKDQTPASPAHAFDAVACALKLVAAAEHVNKLLRQAIQDNYPAIRNRYQSLSREDRETVRIEDLKFQCRVGINTSNPSSDREIDRMRMVMMGAETCADYTAQGGAVIYAFRLESTGTPGQIHVGENTRRLVEHVFQLEEMPVITLKGLGTQNRYRVAGVQSVMDGVYPQTAFYRRFHKGFPPPIPRLLEEISVGRLQFREVRKINEFVELSIPYLEHLAGYYNLGVARALMAHGVAEAAGLDAGRLDALAFACLWHHAAALRDGAMEGIESYAARERIPADMDADQILRILAALEGGQTSPMEAAIIAMCGQFDHMAFDRSLLRNRGQETLSAKEIVSLLRIEDRFDLTLVGLLEDLMVAVEGDATPAEADGHSPIPDDPDLLAEAIEKHLAPEKRRRLMERLNAGEIPSGT